MDFGDYVSVTKKETKDFIKANFRKYFWYFMVYLAGVLTSGIAQYLAK